MSRKDKYINCELLIINIATVISILSFSFLGEIADAFDNLRYVFWILTLLVIYIQSRIKLNFTIKYMAFTTVLFILLNFVFHMLGYYPYTSTGIAGYIGFCMSFYTVGYNFQWQSEKDVKSLFVVSFIAYIILLITAIPEVGKHQEAIYLFEQKNQLGQMLGSGVIIQAFFLARLTNNRLFKIMLYFCSGLTLIALMLIHSRTPLIALVILAIVTFRSKKNKTQNDFVMAIIFVAVIIIAITFLGGTQFIKELFEWNDTTNLNTVEGINDVTSGRIDGYIKALRDFIKSPLIGIGFHAYVDNFVICCLRSGGLLFGLFVIPFIYGKMFKAYNRAKSDKNDERNSLVSNLKLLARNYTIYFFVVSIMEGYPPVGPGASVFLLWLIYGMTDNADNLKKLQEAEGKELNEIVAFSNMK